MQYIVNNFNNLNALSAFIEGNKPNGYFDHGKLSSVTGTKKFTGTRTYEEANNLMLNGWPAGAKSLKAAMTNRLQEVGNKSVMSAGVAGFMPIVARAVTGHPLNMMTKRQHMAPSPIVNILVNNSIHCSITTKQILDATAKIVNVLQGLENSGTRINLYVVLGSTSDSVTTINTLRIKASSDKFNLAKMAYPLMHPSYIRRHNFAVKERSGLSGYWGHYGRPVTDAHELTTHCNIPGGKRFISLLDVIEGKWNEREIVKQLEKQY